MKLQLKAGALLVGLLAFPLLTCGSPGAINEERSNGKLFYKSYSTTTVTALSVVVTTQPYFCALTAGTNACTGRHLRRRRRLDIPEIVTGRPTELEKSTDDDLGKTSDTSANHKLFFTLWQSVTTTITVTSTATNRSITISASAYCTFANYDVPLC